MTGPEPGNKRVARRLLGYFIDGDYREVVQIEYRYSPCLDRPEFDLLTCIRGKEYFFTEYHFFIALAELLDQLPLTSAIMIPHRIVVLRSNIEEIAMLEEWLYPYEIRDGGDTVVYQLKLDLGDRRIETPKRHESGYLEVAFDAAAERLRSELGSEIQLRVCHFCKYLVDYEENGGSDARHDLLYCLRDSFKDNPEAVDELLKAHPSWRSRKPLVAGGTPDMDALHSCSAFVYRETPRW
jgi:hypothetical protein